MTPFTLRGKCNHSLPPSSPNPSPRGALSMNPYEEVNFFLLKANPCMVKNKCFQSPSTARVAGSRTRTLLVLLRFFCLLLLMRCPHQTPGPRELCSHSVFLSYFGDSCILWCLCLSWWSEAVLSSCVWWGTTSYMWIRRWYLGSDHSANRLCVP